jgi:hypothetical protein
MKNEENNEKIYENNKNIDKEEQINIIELKNIAKEIKEGCLPYKRYDKYTLINLMNKEKIKFYKKQKENITFRLNNHKEYFITGKIIKIIESNNNSEFLFILELKNLNKCIFSLLDVDFETLIPSNYNPIRYFIRESISKELRDKIFNRDNNECQLNLDGCSKKAELIDHIIPISKGGLSIEDNLQASCTNCNLKKSNNLLF